MGKAAPAGGRGVRAEAPVRPLQIARRQALLDAFESCPIPLEQVTDDVQLIELAGDEVWLVEGEERNLKITTPLDLRLAELLLQHTHAPHA